MEIWEEVYKNAIPVGKYQTLVSNGEQSGLIIRLESTEHIIKIVFGVVTAFRMLDEGIVLGELLNEIEISKYKKDNFSNTIYKIQEGEFGKFVKKISNELYDYLGLKHYIIVTLNYVIEMVSEWEPSIEVVKK